MQSRNPGEACVRDSQFPGSASHSTSTSASRIAETTCPRGARRLCRIPRRLENLPPFLGRTAQVDPFPAFGCGRPEAVSRSAHGGGFLGCRPWLSRLHRRCRPPAPALGQSGRQRRQLESSWRAGVFTRWSLRVHQQAVFSIGFLSDVRREMKS